MHISKLTIVNYRNFKNATLKFNKGVNTIIGENGAGKTNVFRAIRLLLDDSMVRVAKSMDLADFHRGLERWQGHWIFISAELSEISLDEEIQSLFVHGTGVLGDQPVQTATYNLIFRPIKEVRLRLAALMNGDVPGMNAILNSLTTADYEVVLTGRSTADFANPADYARIVGDFDNAVFPKEVDSPEIGSRLPTYLSVTKEVSLTFIQALRDVVSEFHNNRTNPLLSLLKRMSGEINEELLRPIIGQVQALNQSIEGLENVTSLRRDIRETIYSAAGQTYSPSSLSIKSELPQETDRLFQSLKLFVGESNDEHEGPIHELSLGGANLIFLTLKLLEFKYRNARHTIANFLLIEEPEAHLHTHVQKTLFDNIGDSGAQIIYSTHSTHISEVSNVSNVNVLGRNGKACEAFHPSTGLEPAVVGAVQRYLDAVRSNLLFAKSVLLVEGDAEAILLPLLIKKTLGVSLDELGISLVNIGSTGFSNISILFDNQRIRRRCSIITDQDSAYAPIQILPTDDEPTRKWKKKMEGSAASGAARKAILDAEALGNRWVKPFYATYTFEVDFAIVNQNILVNSINEVYAQDAAKIEARADFQSGQIARYGRRTLTMAAYKKKGWFAILLGKYIDGFSRTPTYILQAVAFAHGTFSRELIFRILHHRLRHYVGQDGQFPTVQLQDYWSRVCLYRNEGVDFNTIRNETYAALPDDQVCDLLRAIP
ncbi:ATP-dependent endonuclease [Herbaspirillum sp. BH-1]|uniref:ATP-dependent nuclease n=1 Tax=Herbaspirillum sp. (strain BH-1) TaxID=2058884 RepID=UPI000C880807|nr:AAA family ATPase [Herbaspirillum sp. BH-1]PLY57876.1 ATP-dependent endonuclease [Herbaspirillum sp. BH-1]